MEGDDHGEAYTAIVWSGLLSLESSNIAEAEAFSVADPRRIQPAIGGDDMPTCGLCPVGVIFLVFARVRVPPLIREALFDDRFGGSPPRPAWTGRILDRRY